MVCQYCSATRWGNDTSMYYTEFGESAGHRATWISNREEWERAHCRNGITQMVGFRPGRVYPDVLHVMDLQVIPDAVASTLLELTDSCKRRQQGLSQLQQQYEAWCKETCVLEFN